MLKIGLDAVKSATITTLADALEAADDLIGDFPIIIRRVSRLWPGNRLQSRGI